MRMLAVSAVIIVALCTCGPAAAPDKPFILTDRASIGFGLEFASATYVDTTVMQHLQVSNRGLQDLHLSAVTLSGDNAFAMKLEGQADNAPPESVLPLSVKGMQATFVELTFAPKRAGMFMGSLVIKSDADNIKELTVPIAGCALQKDAGVRDGGC